MPLPIADPEQFRVKDLLQGPSLGVLDLLSMVLTEMSNNFYTNKKIV